MIRVVLTVVAIVLLPVPLSGCAALLLGYVVGNEIQRAKNTENCRINMRTVNEARIAKGEQPFPDTCGQ